MSAKVTISGQPQNLRIEGDIVTFKINTGPASSTAPKGLPLFEAAVYSVQCSRRQYQRGRLNPDDRSELVIEGYQEPRLDAEKRPYIAVVALSVASKLAQTAKKMQQLHDEVVKAEEAYDQACTENGVESPQALVLAKVFQKSKDGWLDFRVKHPELQGQTL